jgi:hypothetical protein
MLSVSGDPRNRTSSWNRLTNLAACELCTTCANELRPRVDMVIKHDDKLVKVEVSCKFKGLSSLR